MSDNTEYNKLINQKSNAQAQYNSCESRIEDCDDLLRRLRQAKSDIVELKQSFKSNKKLDKKLYEEKHDWEGSTYNNFSNKMVNLINANESYYKNSIDYILDSLNNKITAIENKRMKEYGLLCELGSWINSLSNKIENFFN